MGSRLELHEILTRELGSRNVYYQPPETVKMVYPCIVYQREADFTNHADNRVYLRKRKYALTVIDKNPDSAIPDRIAELPLCTMERFYASENLNHYAFTIYF